MSKSIAQHRIKTPATSKRRTTRSIDSRGRVGGTAGAGGEGGACPRLEIVDPFHREWAAVLTHISKRGQKRVLMLDIDGWLSARQSVVAAFLNGRVIGYLVFHVDPIRTLDGRVAISARADALSTEGATYDPRLSRLLIDFALAHAVDVLKCRYFDTAGSGFAMAA